MITGGAGAAPSTEHPRLFVGTAGLPALWEKVKDPAIAPWLAALLKGCDKMLKEPPVAPPDTPSTPQNRVGGELGRARRAQHRIVSLALGHLLTGSTAYLDRAWAEIECWNDRWASWTDPAHGDGKFFDLMQGEMAATMGIAYDWLAASLDPARRAKLKEIVARRCLEPYLANTDGPKPAWWFKVYHNWNAVCNGGALIAALALENEHSRAREAIGRARAAMRPFFEAFGTEGGWDEGTGYWQYGTRYGIMALAALESCGEDTAGLFDLPGVRLTGLFPVTFCPGGVPVSWGDSGSEVHDPCLYLLGARTRNPDLIRYMDRIRDRWKTHGGGWPVEAFAILWRPVGEPWLPAAGSSMGLAPVRVYGGIGWSVFVDSWENPSFIAGFKCGDLGANHTQLDNNSLQLWAKGEWLAADLGAGVYNADYFSKKRWAMYVVTTAGHNALLIGGRGQLPKTRGALTSLAGGPTWSGVVGDATANYGGGVRRARRHFVVVRKSYVVMLDEVETGAAEKLEWRLHTPGPAEVTPDGAVYKGKAAALHICLPPALLEVRSERDPGEMPSGKHDFVIAASSAQSASSHLIPSVLVPAAPDAPAPKVSWTFRSDRLVVRIVRPEGADLLVWTKSASGWSLSEVQ
ncbi:MAG: heparinase II/III family protein [Candidatus Coatesbacteria bacterium]